MEMDERGLMRSAMELAIRRHPHPNPRVGAIVLDSAGAIVGTGAHAMAGSPHAEALALAQAGGRARGGTLVVTLEPCAHQGRTPACTAAVIEAGVARVIVGAGDPDTQVAGRGIAALQAAGVEVRVGVAGVDAEDLDPGYFHHRRTGRPRLTLKMAASLDGQAAAADGSSQWITSPEARRDAHELRSTADAVLVGAGTVLADDPELSVRLDGHDGPQPRPVVLVGSRPLPPTARVFSRNPLVYSSRPLDLPGEVTVLPGADGVDLESVVEDLGKRNIVDLLVEGGPVIAGAFTRAGLVDRFVAYFAGAVAGGAGVPMMGGRFATVGDLARVAITSVARIGPDVRIDAEVR
ncbi:MAG: riboflavin biosynthesis protein RibD [Actinobacteria bacterium RBG_16_68_21]|nr:MAG: riboflavin biosynthesis protein RibD [Actinobacteria bacterium RBG_16_68_21]